MPEVQILETHKAIRAAVCNKATRYGGLGLPYLIAINVIAEHGDTIDISRVGGAVCSISSQVSSLLSAGRL